jgi:DNA repair exonuclease SbcCD ATPase subunit
MPRRREGPGSLKKAGMNFAEKNELKEERMKAMSQEEREFEALKKELKNLKKTHQELFEHVDKLAQFTRDFLTTVRSEKGHTPVAVERLKNQYLKIGEILRGIWRSKHDIRP